MAELTGTQQTVREIVDALTPDSGVLTAETVVTLRDSTIGRILLPVRHGGVGAGDEEFVAVVGELAAADPSLGWLAAMFNAAAPDGAEPDALVTTAIRGDGELADGRLTGRWDCVVGAIHADWLLLPAGGGRRVLVPRADTHVEAAAVPGGLAAAGVGDVTVSGCAVDERAILGPPGPRAAVLAGAGIAAAVVGSADAVWRRHVEHVRARLATSYGGEEVSTDAFARVSWAASDIDAAQLQVMTALELADVGAAIWAYRQAVARARSAADRLLGSSRHPLDASDPVTRLWGDVQAGCRLAVPLLDGLAR